MPQKDSSPISLLHVRTIGSRSHSSDARFRLDPLGARIGITAKRSVQSQPRSHPTYSYPLLRRLPVNKTMHCGLMDVLERVHSDAWGEAERCVRQDPQLNCMAPCTHQASWKYGIGRHVKLGTHLCRLVGAARRARTNQSGARGASSEGSTRKALPCGRAGTKWCGSRNGSGSEALGWPP